MKITTAIVALFIIALIAGGCSKAESPVGSSSSEMTGNLIGWVILKHTSGVDITDKSGVSVNVEGTPYATTTDANGKWTLTNLPSGTYTVTISKAGYGTYRQFGYQFVGGGNAYFSDLTLGMIPTATVQSLVIQTVDTSHSKGDSVVEMRHLQVEIIPTLSWGTGEPDSTVDVMYYIGTNSNVSSNTADHKFSAAVAAVHGKAVYNLPLSHDGLAYYGMPSGTTIYVVAYAGNRYYRTQYHDPLQRSTITTSLSAPSNVISLVVP
jgi:hypothetical protein